MKLSIVLPVYNEGESIGQVLESVRKHVSTPHETVVVYDSDDDDSIPVVRAHIASDPSVRLHRNHRGRGALNAIRSGFEATSAPYVLVAMADGSDEHDRVDDMVALAEGGAAVVAASRYMKGGGQLGGPRAKALASRTAGLILHHLAGLPVHDPTNNFKLYSRAFIDSIDIQSTGGFELALELTVKAFAGGWRLAEVPTTWHGRAAGESRFQLLRWLPRYLRWFCVGMAAGARRRLPAARNDASRRPSRYFSSFGGLWTDRLDATEELWRRLRAGEVTSEQAAMLKHWITDGFVILDGAVPPEWCDAMAAELARIFREGAPEVLMQAPGEHGGVPVAPGTPPARNRIVDIHAVRPLALDILFSPRIVGFLSLVFGAEPLLFQSLTFERGSEQGIHRDTGYVVVSSPMELAAAWVALEDITPGSGELNYYVGSHRLPEHPFSGQWKHWDPGRDGEEQHREWNQLIHQDAAAMGLPLVRFTPRKGDVLIWSADLAHGGAPVEDPSLTRRSLVGHYCPIGVDPNYFAYAPDRRVARRVRGGWAASEYYSLA